MASLRISIIDESTQRPRLNRARLQRLLDAALRGGRHAQAKATASLTILLVDAAASARLHLAHFDDGEATDVMTFPDGTVSPRPARIHLGDLAVCVDVAIREAGVRGVPVADEITLYILHGLLHLVGYDDTTRAELTRMWAAQRRLLAAEGIRIDKDPS